MLRRKNAPVRGYIALRLPSRPKLPNQPLLRWRKLQHQLRILRLPHRYRWNVPLSRLPSLYLNHPQRPRLVPLQRLPCSLTKVATIQHNRVDMRATVVGVVASNTSKEAAVAVVANLDAGVTRNSAVVESGINILTAVEAVEVAGQARNILPSPHLPSKKYTMVTCLIRPASRTWLR